MTKIATVIALLLTSSSIADSLDGHWEDTGCKPYNDNSSHGTYNYVFQPAGKFETFLKYYSDAQCQISSGFSQAMSRGTYQWVLKSLVNSTKEVYLLELKYENKSSSFFYTAEVIGNEMKLCAQNQCFDYRRR